jgi:hypothetical protein
MAVTRFLARDLTIEISTGPGVDTISGTADDTWTPILGLNTLSHSPSTNRADAGGFDSNGRAKHLVTERGDTWTLSGHSLEDVATGDRDPGQAAVEASAKLTGPTAMRFFRITSPGGNIQIFAGSAELTHPGGGHNDIASWSTTIEVDGEPTYIPAP